MDGCLASSAIEEEPDYCIDFLDAMRYTCRVAAFTARCLKDTPFVMKVLSSMILPAVNSEGLGDWGSCEHLLLFIPFELPE
jgi:hypothetical protein